MLNKKVLFLIITSISISLLGSHLKEDMKAYATRISLSMLIVAVSLMTNLYIIGALDRLNLPYSKNFSNLFMFWHF